MNKIMLVLLGLGLLGIISLAANLQQLIPPIISFIKNIRTWWIKSLPAQKVLGPLADNNKKLLIFVRDFFITNGTPLYSREGQNGIVGTVQNVLELWPNVEGKSISKLLNLLGVAGRTKNIEVVEMGKDPGTWNQNLVILGAQTQKCFDFYLQMEEVAFRVDRNHIYDNKTGTPVKRDPNFGYGIILKCKNPYVTGGKGIGFLLGGYGTLGTEAATYYFTNNIADLGRKFSKKSFGIVIRASLTAGVQSTERIKKFDRVFD